MNDENQNPSGQQGGGESQVTLSREQIRTMERDAQRAREADERAEAAERQLALHQAGIPLDTDLGQFFAANYSGELSTDAIREQAEKLGILKSGGDEGGGEHQNQGGGTSESQGAPTGGGGDQGGSSGATEDRQRLASGAAGDTGQQPPPDPRKAAQDEGQRVLEAGGTREEAGAAVFKSLVGSAMEGDKRVILDSFGQRSNER